MPERWDTRWRPMLAALLLAPLLVGCPRKEQHAAAPERVEIHKLELIDRGVGALVAKKDLETRVRDYLKKVPKLSFIAKRTESSYRVRVEVGVRRTGEGDLAALVSIEARPGRVDGMRLQASTVSVLEGRDTSAAKRRAHLLAALDGVLADIGQQARLTLADPARLVAALAGHDVSQIRAALEIVALRRAKQAVPKVIELLRHPDAEVSDRAIGALVAIGDRRGVKALTSLAKFTDTARMAKVLDAIGALGGPEARQYLEFVAVGHDDADIRALAKEALDRMKRTSDKKE